MKKDVTKKSDKIARAISLGIIVVLAAVALLVVANSVGITGNNILTDAVEQFGTNWMQGDFGIGLAKFMFAAMLLILIYSVIAFVGFGPGTSLALSFLITFLSTAYLTPEEVYTSILGYGSLALALNIALPFFVLLFGSIMVMGSAFQKKGAKRSKEQSAFVEAGKIAIINIAWFAYIVYMVARTIGAMGDDAFSLPVLIAHLIILAFAVGVLYFQKKFRKMLIGWYKEVEDLRNDIEKENIKRKITSVGEINKTKQQTEMNNWAEMSLG